MIVIYRPEGGEEERYDVRKLKTSEAQIVTRSLGMTWAEVKRGVLEDEPHVLAAVVWVLRKRDEPSLRMADFDPKADELVSRFDAREVADYCREIAKAKGAEEEIDAAYGDLLHAAADPEAAEKFIADFRAPGKEPAAKSRTSKTAA